MAIGNIPDNHDLRQVVNYFRGSGLSKAEVVQHLENLITFVEPKRLFELKNQKKNQAKADVKIQELKNQLTKHRASVTLDSDMQI